MYSGMKSTTRALKKKMGIGLVGHRLKEVRERAGLTQHELSTRVNLNSQQIYRYENNMAQPTAINLILMAQALNVSIDYLCGLSDAPFTSKISEDESQLLDNWHRGDMNAVIDMFADKLRKYRDTKTGVSRVEPAINKS